MPLPIPTEPIGSTPRPLSLIEAIRARGRGLESGAYDEAIRDTLKQGE